MSKSYILVIGSVPKKLYDLVRLEVRKIYDVNPRIIRLESHTLDDFGDMHDFGDDPRQEIIESIRANHPEFDPELIRVILAYPEPKRELNWFLDDVWGSNDVGTERCPYYEVEELEGRNALVGCGLGTGFKAKTVFQPKD